MLVLMAYAWLQLYIGHNLFIIVSCIGNPYTVFQGISLETRNLIVITLCSMACYVTYKYVTLTEVMILLSRLLG